MTAISVLPFPVEKQEIGAQGYGSFTLEGIEFVLRTGDAIFHSQSTPHRFLLAKNTRMITAYWKLGQRTKLDRVLDLGIFKGGSVALFDKLFCPRKLVGIDLSTDRVTALDAYMAEKADPSSMAMRYGLDQADSDSLRRIVAEEFHGVIDFVVDDASHAYKPTRTSFNTVFPYLRPGGFYVIEDWAWAHWQQNQTTGGLFPDQPAPSNFVCELVLMAASYPRFLSSLAIEGDMVIAERGPDSIDNPTGFDIADFMITRQGRRLEPTL